LELSPTVLDKGDPNYDEADDMGHLDLFLPAFSVSSPEAPLAAVKASFDESITAFFSSGGELDELAEPLEGHGGYAFALLKRLIWAAAGRTPAARELVSRALSDGYPTLWPRSQIAFAFRELLIELPDAQLDMPSAPDSLARFLARAIADECVDPAFVADAQALAKSASLPSVVHTCLSVTERLVRDGKSGGALVLDSVWGPHARASVAGLKAALSNIVAEVAVSGDVDEAIRSVRELGVEVVRFHLVKVALIACVDAPSSHGYIVAFLRKIWDDGVLGEPSFGTGITLVIQGVGELTLDVSRDAPSHLKAVLAELGEAGVIPTERVPVLVRRIDENVAAHKEQVAEMRKRLAASRATSKRLGGASDPRPVDDRVRELTLQLREDAARRLGDGTTFAAFEPLQYCAQVVAGAMYFVSVRTGAGEADQRGVHLRIFQALPHEGSTVSLLGAKVVDNVQDEQLVAFS
jgi:hypothetical protein